MTAVASVVGTAVLVAGTTLIGRAVSANLEVGLSRITHSCLTDPTLSGVQGYCLDRLSRPDLGLAAPRGRGSGRHTVRGTQHRSRAEGDNRGLMTIIGT